MSTILFKNNAVSTLNGAITGAATTISIQAIDAPLFPVPAANEYFMLVLEDRTQTPFLREIVQVTSVSGNTFTVVRGQENTNPEAFNSGVTVSHRITAGSLQAIMNAAVIGSLPIYIGPFAVAPSAMPNGTSLVIGTLYFNTTSMEMFEWNTASQWVVVGSPAASNGLYLGQFATPPTLNDQGGPLELGSLYWDTTLDGLYVYEDGWTIVTNVNNITGNVVISGNLTVGGNLTVTGTLTVGGQVTMDDVSISGTLILDGLPVVTANELSGNANSQTFPDGTIMQWGTGTTETPIVFPTPYTTVCDYVQFTLVDPVNQGTSYVDAVTKNGFTPHFRLLESGALSATAGYWLASGK